MPEFKPSRANTPLTDIEAPQPKAIQLGTSSLATEVFSGPSLEGDAVAALQHSLPIRNLPAGVKTETPVYAVSDVPRDEYVTPDRVAHYLRRDRREIEEVACRASAIIGQPVTAQEALALLSDRMIELMVKAQQSVATVDNSPLGTFLTKLSFATEINPDSWRLRAGVRLGLMKVVDAADVLAPDSSVSLFRATHMRVGEKLFALKDLGAQNNLELKTEIKRISDKYHAYELNPHKRTLESSTAMHNDLRLLADKLGMPEELLLPPQSTFEEGRYRVGELGMIVLARGGGDFIISHRTAGGVWMDIRLNWIQLEHAQRGVFPKWDESAPPTDYQQRIYPTSPLKFWEDHLRCCGERLPELLARVRAR